jgi:uncharacterized protein involved in tolerance to divalent cations
LNFASYSPHVKALLIATKKKKKKKKKEKIKAKEPYENPELERYWT